ncbi:MULTISPECIES: hypothetical protein [unclassified Coleofasciculus]|uniref:hypothetical protein n=1 Tax=unclassified Coleofasciculus TaxID=2692782 RepID=UPI00187F6F19|nr:MULTISPECIES: hypothetical protein [unclassified Coleofasciculus]MBE9125306.1 hypothetical protein [Coleofasciculus sp. LEGE 07081]MBE9147087.1 hypothetical protein [Coleofasciculus sp. LEGE 07092]
MSYKEQLFPWCIIRHLPDMQRTGVARLRRRSDAEEHLRVLRRLMPDASFSIVFDPMLESTDTNTELDSRENTVGEKI